MLKEKEQQIKTQITSLDTRDALIQYLKKNFYNIEMMQIMILWNIRKCDGLSVPCPLLRPVPPPVLRPVPCQSSRHTFVENYIKSDPQFRINIILRPVRPSYIHFQNED